LISPTVSAGRIGIQFLYLAVRKFGEHIHDLIHLHFVDDIGDALRIYALDKLYLYIERHFWSVRAAVELFEGAEKGDALVVSQVGQDFREVRGMKFGQFRRRYLEVWQAGNSRSGYGLGVFPGYKFVF